VNGCSFRARSGWFWLCDGFRYVLVVWDTGALWLSIKAKRVGLIHTVLASNRFARNLIKTRVGAAPEFRLGHICGVMRAMMRWVLSDFYAHAHGRSGRFNSHGLARRRGRKVKKVGLP